MPGVGVQISGIILLADCYGPSFQVPFPPAFTFSNSSGGILDCQVGGEPPPCYHLGNARGHNPLLLSRSSFSPSQCRSRFTPPQIYCHFIQKQIGQVFIKASPLHILIQEKKIQFNPDFSTLNFSLFLYIL